MSSSSVRCWGCQGSGKDWDGYKVINCQYCAGEKFINIKPLFERKVDEKIKRDTKTDLILNKRRKRRYESR